MRLPSYLGIVAAVADMAAVPAGIDNVKQVSVGKSLTDTQKAKRKKKNKQAKQSRRENRN